MREKKDSFLLQRYLYKREMQTTLYMSVCAYIHIFINFSLSLNICIYIYILYIYRVERWNCCPRKDDMIPFPFNENQFSFFVADHLLVGSCVQIPRAIGAFCHAWKWHNVQWVRSEMRCCTTYALYWSKLWQQDHCQHPQNAKLDCYE